MEQLPIKRVLVALDLSDHDDVLMSYIDKVASLADLDAVYFLHVANDLDIPKDVLENYPDLLAPVDESLEKSIAYITEGFKEKYPDIKTDILIREGKTSMEVLKAVKRKEIDLLVLGRKNNRQANLNIVRKIVRSAPCTISLIPEYIPDALDKILIPVDFSENSLLALRRAQFFQEKYSNLDLIALNVYQIPHGYTKTGKSYEEFKEIMLENAKKETQYFLKKHNLRLDRCTWKYICHNHTDLHILIYEQAVSHGANAIIMGSKGRNPISQLILGSVTEAVLEHDQYLPLIIVKDRKESMGLLEAVMKL
jgi:nucleotide-binding universal stress UspA family protein